MRTDVYAPVARCEALELPLSSGEVIGLAYPASGSKPCALALMAGNAMISTVAAVLYSPEAYSRGIRRGWCGFRIGGLGQAIALGDVVELRCRVSNDLLMQWNGAELATSLHAPSQKHLSVDAMRIKLHDKGVCMDVERVLPFAVDLAQRDGTRAYLDATFLYLLGRLPDLAATITFADDYSTMEAARRCWRDVMASPEYRSLGRVGCAAPFTATFPFPLDILDENRDSDTTSAV